jgi:hypothetical protein
MEALGWVVAGVVILLALIVFRKRVMKPNPAKYFQRSQERMQKFHQQSVYFDRLLGEAGPNNRRLALSALRLRQLAEEQRNEVVPPEYADAVSQHKNIYFSLMDIQARKAEDVVQTGGANLDALTNEEAALHERLERDQQAHGDWKRQQEQQWGITFPR